MAIKFFGASRLDTLFEQFHIEERKVQRGVFDRLLFVTQVEGINNFLKKNIVSRDGILANVEYLSPAQLLNRIYFGLGGDFEEPLSQSSVSWLVYNELGNVHFISSFPAISNYYTTDGEINDVKRFGLAEKLADLFDQYQIYRPAMINKWNTSSPENTIRDWQQYLWLKIRAAVGERFPDKTKQGNFILSALKNKEAAQALRSRYNHIHFFGISILTPYHIDLYSAIGAAIDINFFMLNPAPEIFWFDDKSNKQLAKIPSGIRASFAQGNDLLLEFGKAGRDSFRALFSHEIFSNAYLALPAEPVESETLLSRLQYEIAEARPDDQREMINKELLQDGSIILNACYTASREIEVLYNHILDRVDQHPGKINLSKILVLSPDLPAYLPYIHARFSNSKYPVPYYVVDEPVSERETVLSALNDLLNISEENFTAEAVLALLDHVAIRNKFGISDINLIREVVNTAGIRYGTKNSMQDETWLVSWNAGIRRILYGIAFIGSPFFNEDELELRAIDAVEGIAANEVISFIRFVTKLIQQIENRKRKRSLTAWSQYIYEVLDSCLFTEDDEQSAHLQTLDKALSNFTELEEIRSTSVSYPVMLDAIRTAISESVLSPAHRGHGICFSPMLSMRSVPADHICLIGINPGFPRLDHKVTFDKMAQHPQPGDRSIKENDKALFLDALMSAGKSLYISYLGINATDNSVIPPSIAIDSLLNYIQVKTNDLAAEDFLLHVHPLHPHSRMYNRKDSDLKSYTIPELNPVDFHGSENNIEIFNSELKLTDIISFYQDSLNFYFQKHLGIYYNEIKGGISEEEIFEFDSLQLSYLMTGLFHVQDAKEFERFINAQKHSGAHPLGNLGLHKTRKIFKRLRDIAGEATELINSGQSTSIDFDFTFNNNQKVTGGFSDKYGNKIIRVVKSKDNAKHLYRLRMEALFAKAAGIEIEAAYLINLNDAMDSDLEIQTVELHTPETAARIAENLITTFNKYKDQLTVHMHDLEELTDRNSWIAGLEKYQYHAFLPLIIEGLTEEDFETFSQIRQSLNTIYPQ